MKATIWHNPACGTSRKTLAILEATPGIELAVVEYLKTPPSAQKLAQLYRDAGMTPAHGLRLRGTDAAERGLPEADDAAVLAAMAAQPNLIERPLVETAKGVRLCRRRRRCLKSCNPSPCHAGAVALFAGSCQATGDLRTTGANGVFYRGQ
jgi:arsenate reductase